MAQNPDLKQRVLDILPVQRQDNGCMYWRRYGRCAYVGEEKPGFRKGEERTKCVADSEAVPFCLPSKEPFSYR